MLGFAEAKAPLRLGFAGGGTDVSPYPEMFGGNVLNATISKYARTRITRTESGFRFIAKDISDVPESLKSGVSESTLPLHQAVFEHFVRKDKGLSRIAGLTIETSVDAPIGSGLGASSALVVSMVSAFGGILEIPLKPREIAEIAYEIERHDCGFNGGKQDQYSASFGGVNFIDFFGGNDVRVTPLILQETVAQRLNEELMVYYSGKSRKSAEIISDQIRTIEDPGGQGLESMHRIKQEATMVREALHAGDFESLYSSIRRGWDAKKSTSSSISTERLDAIVDGALERGAGCGKVSGAGGGGFILFMVPRPHQDAVWQFLVSSEGSVEKVKMETKGVELWTK